MSELRAVKRQLASRKGMLTRSLSRLSVLMEKNSDSAVVEETVTAAEKQFQETELIQNRLNDLLEEEQMEAELDKWMDVQSQKIDIVAKARTYCSTCSSQTALNSVSRTSQIKVKLPKLNLPQFTGDRTQWVTFWDTFVATVDANDELSDVEKFQYLSASLKGQACAAIAGLRVTEANYPEAVEILKRRYGDKQTIITAHMNALMNMSPLSENEESLDVFRRFADKIVSNIRGLHALGTATESYAAMMSPLIMGKLPSNWRIAMTRMMTLQGKDPNDLNAIADAMQNEITLHEQNSSSTLGTRQATSQRRPPTHRNDHTASALTAARAEWDGPRCCFCGRSGHRSEVCRTVTDPVARKATLKRFGRCFLCLRRQHTARMCSENGCQTCGGRHHVSLCESGASRQPAVVNQPTQHSLDGAPATQNAVMNVSSEKAVLLQTARAQVGGPGENGTEKSARLMFDSGSERTFITEAMKNALNLRAIATEKLKVRTFGSKDEQFYDADVVQLYVRTLHGEAIFITAYVVPVVCLPLNGQPVKFCQQKYPHLKGLSLAEVSESSNGLHVDILIGADFMWTLTTGRMRRGQSGPTALETKVGWVLSGPADRPEGEDEAQITSLNTVHALDVCVDLDRKEDSGASMIKNTLSKFWDLESIGIKADEETLHEKVVQKLRLKDGRYETGLPWKENHPLLPDNYQTALKRLGGVAQKLKKTPDILMEYDKIIKQQIETGIVEPVPDEEAETGRVHYIPHHAVVREDQDTTKLRVVYDASCSTTGTSLNDCVYAGPSLVQDLFDIQLRFRCHKIGILADIEKAFHMISVKEEDRDVLRFLWFRDIYSPEKGIIKLRFTRVPFGIRSSPFLLNAVLQAHVQTYEDSAFADSFVKSCYVDDLVSGGDDEEGAAGFYMRSKECLAKGGFNLRKFRSNAKPLMEKMQKESEKTAEDQDGRITEEDSTYASLSTGLADETGNQKVLGISWDMSRDLYKFTLKVDSKNKQTKRQMVSTVSKLYDPTGLVSPFIAPFKMFLQDISADGGGWDEPVSERLQDRWRVLCQELQEPVEVSIPRWYFKDVSGQVRHVVLHGFGDASTRACAVAVYLQIKTGDGGSFGRLVASKTRVAPLTKQTIPRLELISALMLARLVTKVKNALQPMIKLDETKCWTDSTTVWWWIRKEDREYQQFVQNRVTEIRRLVASTCWNHCAGSDNPADLPTRGLKKMELANCQRWWNGPEWLNGAEKEEVASPDENQPPEEFHKEVKKTGLKSCQALTNQTKMASDLTKTFDVSENIGHLLRITAWTLRFIKNLKCAKLDRKSEIRKGSLSVEEMEEAEKMWIMDAQEQIKRNEMKRNKMMTQLGVFQDEHGILRCRGRLQNADLPYETQHPILLPRDHVFTELIIWRCHQRVAHNGVKETLAELRGKFWVVRGRQLVRRLLHSCFKCRKYDAKTLAAPSMAPLPSFRCTQAPAFAHVGIDFAGDLQVKEKNGSKFYPMHLLLYTCAVTRAVHLELVPDLTTESVMRSLIRLRARRGTPRTITSDNAKAFKAAAKLLQSLQKNNTVMGSMATDGIVWRFNLEKAPWWGGFYERMIRSVKRCLKKMLGSASLTHDELVTVLAEVEGILNSRPLTYVSTEEVDEPLTPSHLMIGRRLNTPSWGTTEPTDLTIGDCVRRLNHLQKVMDHFWRRWSMEYLLGLRQHHRMDGKGSASQMQLEEGEIVLIKEDGMPRQKWRLGRVQKLVPGGDGVVRAAEIRVAASGRASSLIRRPIQALVPMEVKSAERSS